MGKITEVAIKEALGREKGLRLHMQCNFFPPLPGYVQDIMVEEFCKHWGDYCHYNVLLERINKRLEEEGKELNATITGLRSLEKFEEFLVDECEMCNEPEEEVELRGHKDERMPGLGFYGKKKYVDKAVEVMAKEDLDWTAHEGALRNMISPLMNKAVFSNVRVLYKGNSIYGSKKLLADLKMVIDKNDMDLMSDDLYKFFSLCCGSIAHYNKAGWIAEYPNVSKLTSFFSKNEYGQGVCQYQPSWAVDRIAICRKMYRMLIYRKDPDND